MKIWNSTYGKFIDQNSNIQMWNGEQFVDTKYSELVNKRSEEQRKLLEEQRKREERQRELEQYYKEKKEDRHWITKRLGDLWSGWTGFVDAMSDAGESLVVDLPSYLLSYGADLVGADKTADKLKNFAQKDLYENYYKKVTGETAQETMDDYGTWVKSDNIAGQVVQAAGAMMPYVLTGNVYGATSGFITMAGTSIPQSLNEAYSEGATDAEAFIYSLANVGVEYATEKLFAGIPGTKSAGWADNLAAKMLKKSNIDDITNSFLKELGTIGYKMVGEGFEEGLAEVANPLLKNMIYNAGDDVKVKDIFNSFLVGALTSGFIEAPVNTVRLVNTYQQKKLNGSSTKVVDKMNMESWEQEFNRLSAKEDVTVEELNEFYKQLTDSKTELRKITDIDMDRVYSLQQEVKKLVMEKTRDPHAEIEHINEEIENTQIETVDDVENVQILEEQKQQLIEKADKGKTIPVEANREKVRISKMENFTVANNYVNELNKRLEAKGMSTVKLVDGKKLSETNQQIVDVAEAFGAQIIFVEGNDALNGSFVPGLDNCIFFNTNDLVISTAIVREDGVPVELNVSKQFAFSVGHEIFHMMKYNNNTLAKQFMSYLQDTLDQSQINEYLKYRYGHDTALLEQKRMNPDEVIEEISADEFGKLFTDKKLFEKIVQYDSVKNTSLAKKIVAYVKKVLDDLTHTKFRSVLTNDQIRTTRNMFENIVKDAETKYAKQQGEEPGKHTKTELEAENKPFEGKKVERERAREAKEQKKEALNKEKLERQEKMKTDERVLFIANRTGRSIDKLATYSDITINNILTELQYEDLVAEQGLPDDEETPKKKPKKEETKKKELVKKEEPKKKEIVKEETKKENTKTVERIVEEQPVEEPIVDTTPKGPERESDTDVPKIVDDTNSKETTSPNVRELTKDLTVVHDSPDTLTKDTLDVNKVEFGLHTHKQGDVLEGLSKNQTVKNEIKVKKGSKIAHVNLLTEPEGDTDWGGVNFKAIYMDGRSFVDVLYEQNIISENELNTVKSAEQQQIDELGEEAYLDIQFSEDYSDPSKYMTAGEIKLKEILKNKGIAAIEYTNELETSDGEPTTSLMIIDNDAITGVNTKDKAVKKEKPVKASRKELSALDMNITMAMFRYNEKPTEALKQYIIENYNKYHELGGREKYPLAEQLIKEQNEVKLDTATSKFNTNTVQQNPTLKYYAEANRHFSDKYETQSHSETQQKAAEKYLSTDNGLLKLKEAANRVILGEQAFTAEQKIAAVELLAYNKSLQNSQRMTESETQMWFDALTYSATEEGRAVEINKHLHLLDGKIYAQYVQNKLYRIAYKTFNSDPNITFTDYMNEISDANNFTLTDAQLSYAEDMFNKAMEYNEGSPERNKRLALIDNMINSKISPKWGQKMNAFRRLAMLTSPKTWMKNSFSQATMLGLERLVRPIGTMVDKVTSKVVGTNIRSMTNKQTVVKETVKRIDNEINTLEKEIKSLKGQELQDAEIKLDRLNTERNNIQTRYSDAISALWEAYELDIENINSAGYEQHITPDMFKSSAAKFAEKLVYGILETSDTFFYTEQYNYEIRNAVEAYNMNNSKKISKPTEQMRIDAAKRALEVTFKNKDSKLYKTLDGFRQSLNNIKIGGEGAGDILVPYFRTPVNLAETMVKFSPAGLAYAVNDYKKLKRVLNNKTATNYDIQQAQYQFARSTAKMLTGSMLMTVAIALAKAGALTGDEPEDKRVADLLKENGWQPYSLKIGDKYISYNWADPVSALLKTSSKIANPSEGDKSILSEAFSYGGEQLSEMVGLETYKTLLGASDYGDSTLVDGIIDSIATLPASFVPNAFRDIANIIDNKKKVTWDKNPATRAYQQTLAKVPFLKSTLETKVDTLGKEQTYSWDDIFLPGSVSTYAPNPVANAIYEVYNTTGNTGVLASEIESKINYTDGNNVPRKVSLTENQQNRVQKLFGDEYIKGVDELIRSDVYAYADPVVKSKLIQSVKEYARTHALIESGYLPNYKPTKGSTYEQILRYQDAGLSLASAIIYDGAISPMSADKDANGNNIAGTENGKKAYAIMDLNVSNDEKNVMLQLISPQSNNPETVTDLRKLIDLDDYCNYYAVKKSDYMITNNFSRADYQNAKAIGMDGETFLKVSTDLANMRSDYDAQGNSINGSKKMKVIQYLNNSGLSELEIYYMYAQLGYSVKQNKARITSLINSLNLSANDKKVIYDSIFE